MPRVRHVLAFKETSSFLSVPTSCSHKVHAYSSTFSQKVPATEVELFESMCRYEVQMRG